MEHQSAWQAFTQQAGLVPEQKEITEDFVRHDVSGNGETMRVQRTGFPPSSLLNTPLIMQPIEKRYQTGSFSHSKWEVDVTACN
jgi:hypothetical protein